MDRPALRRKPVNQAAKSWRLVPFGAFTKLFWSLAMMMKSFTLLFVTSILLLAGSVLAAPLSREGGKAKDAAAKETTVTGYISDSSCGLKHMEGMGDEKSCTLMCTKDGNSKFVLADRDGKKVYSLDKAGQAKARDFAGQKVKVTGRLKGKTISVTNIEAV
jgi:hypothetical protein